MLVSLQVNTTECSAGLSLTLEAQSKNTNGDPRSGRSPFALPQFFPAPQKAFHTDVWTSQLTAVLMIQPHANSSLSFSPPYPEVGTPYNFGKRALDCSGKKFWALENKIHMCLSLGSQTPRELERHRGKLLRSKSKCWFKVTFRFYLESGRLTTIHNFMSFHTWLYNLVRITKMAQENVICIGTVQKENEQNPSLHFSYPISQREVKYVGRRIKADIGPRFPSGIR